MVNYYTYRLKEEPIRKNKISIGDVPIALDDGDTFLVFLAGTLEVLGVYIKKDNGLILDKNIEGKKLSDLYGCFGMVSFVNERTYKMFAKRIREIEKEDIDNILDLV